MQYKPFSSDVLFLAGVTFRRGAVNGYVWTSDTNGKGSWQPGGGGVTPAALTKTDDTNVTLTLGGTPATALLQATSITVGWSGQLAVSRGGTGLGTLGTANQLIRVNAGATALEYFTPTYLTGLTVGTTPIASGTAGRILFEGAGNVVQQHSGLNYDTTNGLIIGGATARATRLTIVNSANTYATKIFVQRNAADSSDYTTLRGDGVWDFNNIPNNTSVNGLISASGFTLIGMIGQALNYNLSFGISNSITYSGGSVTNIIAVGSFNSVVSTSGLNANTVLGNRNTFTNGSYNNIIGAGVNMNGNTRSNIIGGRSTGSTPNQITGNDVTIIGWNTDTTALAYTASLVTYFNATQPSHWLHQNGNIGLFGKAYTIHTNTGSNPLNTRMDINATNTLTIHNGTAPSVTIADAVQVYAADQTAGNSALFVRTENNDIIKIYSIGGWGTPTGTLTRTTFDTTTVTLSELAERVAALISDFKTGQQFLKA